MRAALDETYPEGRGGIFYVVGSTIVVADERTAATALAAVIDQPGRTRPFHWHMEGAASRERMVKCLIDLGVVAHVCIHYPTGRKGLVGARDRAITALIPQLLADGTNELLIETRGPREDARDRATILSALRQLEASGTLAYSWHPKREPLLWLADAVCGAVRSFLLQTVDIDHYDRLAEAGVIGDLLYIAPDPPGPRHA